MTTPACAIDHWTRPEQSNTLGPSPPQTYGRPRRLSAAFRNAMVCASLRPGPLVLPPAAPAAATVPEVAFCATSDATAAPRGSTFLTRFISVLRSAFGAQITIALPA